MKVNEIMFNDTSSIGITENNIHILNLFYENKNLKKEKGNKKAFIENIVKPISKKLKEINSNYLKNIVDTPFENSMFFILAIFYAQFLDEDFKLKIERYHKINKEYIDQETENTIKKMNSNYNFINTCFHMVSLLSSKNKKIFRVI